MSINNKKFKTTVIISVFLLIIVNIFGANMRSSNLDFPFSERNVLFDDQPEKDIKELLSPRASPALVWNYTTLYNIKSVAISSNGSYIAAGGEDNCVYLFNKSSSTPMWKYDTLSKVTSVAISANGSYIAAGTENFYVYLFNKSSSTPMWKNHTSGEITSVAISANGSYIAAGTENFYVYLFNKSSSTPMWEYNTLSKVTSVAISANGSYITAGNENFYVYLFNKASSTPMWQYITLGVISSVAISANGSYIAAGSEDTDVYLFDKSSSTPMWQHNTGGIVTSVAISANGSYIAAGSEDTDVYLFDKSSSTPMWQHNTGGIVTSVAISANGSYIAAGSEDTYIYLFNKSSSTPLRSYATGDDINSVAISSEGNYIAAGSEDKSVYLFNWLVPSDFLLSDDADNPDMDGNFNLNWSVSNGADNYSVYVYNKSITKINSSVEKCFEGLTQHSTPISGLGYGDYYYVVVAFNDIGNTTSNCIHISVRAPPISFVLSSDAKSPDNDGNFNLNWEVSDGADNYSVYVYDKYITEINASVEKRFEGLKQNTTLISGLIYGDYYYVVVAFNQVGNTTSNCIHVSIRTIPTTFKLSSEVSNQITNGTFVISWSPSTGADNYSIYVHDKYITEINSSVTLLESSITKRSFSIQNYTSGDYYFVIVAYNSIGNSSSNCLLIKVVNPSQDIIDLSILFLVIIIGSISAISTSGAYVYQKKRNRNSSLKRKSLTRPELIPNKAKGDINHKKKKKLSAGSEQGKIEISEAEKMELTEIESEVDVQKTKFTCIVHRGPIVGTVYICPNCQTFYCERCAKVLKLKGEKCWSCENEITIATTDKDKLELIEKKTSNIIEEIIEEMPFVKEYIETNKSLEEIPEVKEHILSLFSPEDLDDIDLLDFTIEDKKLFIKEIISLSAEERKQIIKEMLSNRK